MPAADLHGWGIINYIHLAVSYRIPKLYTKYIIIYDFFSEPYSSNFACFFSVGGVINTLFLARHQLDTCWLFEQFFGSQEQ